MAKLTLNDLASLANDASVISTINNNNDAIEAALENTLSRDGTSPNQMGATLDMNSNRIINLPEATGNGQPLRYEDITTIIDLEASAAQHDAAAAASAVSAASSADSAASDATAVSGVLAAVEAVQDAIDDTYLGAKTTDPLVDNDGDALTAGDWYFNTVSNSVRIFNGTLWFDAVQGNAINTSFTPAGTIGSTNVQDALEELDDDIINLSFLNNVVEDTTPQLGGDLDLNSNDITGTGSLNITGTIDTTGDISTDGAIYALGGSIPTSGSTAGVFFGKESANNNRAIQIVTAASGQAYIDFAEPSQDYGARILATPGSGASGTGALALQAASLAVPATAALANAATPLSAKITGASTGVAPVLKLSSENSSHSNNDIMWIDYTLQDSTGAETIFARAYVQALNVSNGAEEGHYIWTMQKAGVLSNILGLTSAALYPLTTVNLGTTTSPFSAGYLTTIELGHATDTTLSRASAGVVAIEGNNILTANLIGSTVQAYDVDTLKADVSDTLAIGFRVTVYDLGTVSSGTVTPDALNSNFQKAVNGGAHTLAPPGNSCNIVLQYTNNGSAGTITTSGFTKQTGDAFTTVNGDDFLCYITKSGSFSHLNVVALQ